MRYKLSLLATGLLIANAASAATEINLHKQPAAYLQKQLAAQADSKTKVMTVRTDVDFNHTAHTRIQQMYNGIPVWDATGVIHTPNIKRGMRLGADANATMNGVIYEGLEKDLASAPAFANTKSQQLKALQVAKNLHARKSRMAVSAFKDEKSQPIIFVDSNKQAHYAYLTSFTYLSSSAAHRPTSIVDAVTGKVYRTWEGILSASAQEEQTMNTARAIARKLLDGDEQPPAYEMYPIKAGGIGGNVKMGEWIYDGRDGNKPALDIKAVDVPTEIIPGNPYMVTYCYLMSDDITVYDVANQNISMSPCAKNSKTHNGLAWLSLNKGQTRWNDDEMNDGYSPSLDAFYAATIIKGFYQDWYNVPALIDADGNPMKYMMRVHFGRKFDNAFWDGQQMTFGDGGSMFYPMTSVGVTAHEISHGFTDTHSHLDYFNPQMGALHESFSDMAAVTVENYMTGKNGWDLGREIKKDEGALRYLDNPTKDGRSIDHMKDFDATEVHGGAGITNKAFYLLATTKGWNTRKAFDVWVKANMHYWTSSMSTFNEAACGVVAATKDYGYEVADVRVAFAKVGIDTDTCEVV